MHHHHAFGGVEQLVLLVAVLGDHPVFRVVGGRTDDGPLALIDLLQNLSNDVIISPFLRVASRIT
jgi:hypothetical protein